MEIIRRAKEVRVRVLHYTILHTFSTALVVVLLQEARMMYLEGRRKIIEDRLVEEQMKVVPHRVHCNSSYILTFSILLRCAVSVDWCDLLNDIDSIRFSVP